MEPASVQQPQLTGPRRAGLGHPHSPSHSQRSLPLQWSPGPSVVCVPLPEAPSQTGCTSGRPFSGGKSRLSLETGGARPPRVGLGLATCFLAGPGQGARQSSGAGTGDPGFPGSAHVCTVQRPSRPRPAQQAPVAGGTRQRHALGPTVSCPGPSPSGKSACETEKGIFYVECQCDFTCACARVLTQACVCV